MQIQLPSKDWVYGTNETLQDPGSNPRRAQRLGPMSAGQAFPAQPPGPRQARPADARLSHLQGCSDACRLSDKDQEETQMSTRAVHILQVGRERGWAVSGAPSRPRLRLLRAPCCLAEGPMVKTAGVGSGTWGQGLLCHGRGRAPAGCRVQTQPGVPPGPATWEGCADSQPHVQRLAQCLLSWAKSTS